jgi:hypothetical protein
VIITVPVSHWPLPTKATAASFSGSTVAAGKRQQEQRLVGSKNFNRPSQAHAREAPRAVNCRDTRLFRRLEHPALPPVLCAQAI